MPIDKFIYLLYKYNYNYPEFEFYNNKILSLYDIFPRSNKIYIKPNNNCKELVIYGSNLESSVHLPKYTNIVSYMVNIPHNLICMLVGILLTDGHINIIHKKSKIKHKGIYTELNGRFYLKQSLNHSEYLIYVFNKLSHYCTRYPWSRKVYLKGKEFYAIEFMTRALPCITLLRYKFYNGRIKIIPEDIYDYLSYEGLAHMIMCDGSLSRGSGIILNLQAFTTKELILFMNVLKIKFDIDCTLHKSRNKYNIYITTNSVKKIYPYIKPYIIDNMKHKLSKKIKELDNN